MRILILSAGRPDYQLTLASIPESLHSKIEVFVPKSEYKEYKRSPFLSKVGAIHAWPQHVDCVPRKRAWVMRNVNEPHLLLDDDLTIQAWDSRKHELLGTDTKRGFELLKYHLFETIPENLKHYDYLGLGGRFMYQQKVLKADERGMIGGEVPVCAVGKTQSAKKFGVKFTTFFFTDVSIPMQMKARGHKVGTFYGLIYSQRANQKLAKTGTSPYRSDPVVKYSAMSMARMFKGSVFGLKSSGESGGGWTLLKRMVDLGSKDPTEAAVQKAKHWIKTFCTEERLKALPPLVNICTDISREELYDLYAQNWKQAQRGIGDRAVWSGLVGDFSAGSKARLISSMKEQQ